MMNDEQIDKAIMEDRALYLGQQMWLLHEAKRLRAVLSSIAEIVPETAPEAWMVQEARDALGVGYVE